MVNTVKLNNKSNNNNNNNKLLQILVQLRKINKKKVSLIEKTIPQVPLPLPAATTPSPTKTTTTSNNKQNN